jgi:hypothetical protein
VLQFAANFECIKFKKTIDNVVDWIMESMEELKVNHPDMNQVTADGAGNAIGSVSEFESRTRQFRGGDIYVDVCIAHQNERSGGYASGTVKFADPVNAELGLVLAKNHKTQTFLMRSAERMKVYQNTAEDNGRDPILRPKPGIDIRWHSSIDEAERGNLIMGDVCQTLNHLFGEDGLDDELLSGEEEEETGNIDGYMYTGDDKMILRQYEAAAGPARDLTKFLQSKGNSRFSYLLYYIKWCLQRHSMRSMAMPQGMFLRVV